jgi:hypothetical protein
MAASGGKNGKATDGNAARKIEESSATMPETPVSRAAAQTAANTRKRANEGRDERFKDYAARFLSEELPESLRPTKDDKRLQVALVWGQDQFVAIEDIAPGKILTAGSGHGATLPLSHSSLGPVTPLVQPSGQGFRILIPSGTTANVRSGGKESSLDELLKSGKAQSVDVPVKGGSYEIGLEDRVKIDFGNLQLIARYTRPQVTVARPLGERLDVGFISTLLMLLLIGVTVIMMVRITDFSKSDNDDDLFKNKDRFAKYIAKVEEQKKPDQLSGVKEGAKPKDEEGKFGKKEAVQKEAAPSKKGAPVVDKDKREKDREKVAKAGLLGLLGDTAATSDVLGPGGIGTGLNDAIGGISGAAAMGDAYGVGGLGARGGGAGGGGTGLGIGGLGGHGTGRGRGGSGEFDLGGKGKGQTQFVPGNTHVVGGLTADEVGRIIRRHWNEIKYCYEKELTKDPNLAGKVAVSFQIGPIGDVVTAKVGETDLHNNNVEECMLSNVRRWKFPNPRGGGVVDVNYPFIFSAGK